MILVGLFYSTVCFLWNHRPRGKWRLKGQTGCLGGHMRPKRVLSLQWETTGRQRAAWHHRWETLSRDRRWKWHWVGTVEVRNSSGMWRRERQKRRKKRWQHSLPSTVYLTSLCPSASTRPISRQTQLTPSFFWPWLNERKRQCCLTDYAMRKSSR